MQKVDAELIDIGRLDAESVSCVLIIFVRLIPLVSRFKHFRIKDTENSRIRRSLKNISQENAGMSLICSFELCCMCTGGYKPWGW